MGPPLCAQSTKTSFISTSESFFQRSWTIDSMYVFHVVRLMSLMYSYVYSFSDYWTLLMSASAFILANLRLYRSGVFRLSSIWQWE